MEKVTNIDTLTLIFLFIRNEVKVLWKEIKQLQKENMGEQILRLPAEQLFQKEIDALIAAEKDPVPVGWKMSPRSVRTYRTEYPRGYG